MRVRVAHTSLQFKDTPQHHTADIEKIFDRLAKRRVGWITGTEAGRGANNTGEELVRIAKEHGYRPWVPAEQGKAATDSWIAVRNDLISGNWERDHQPVIPGSSELYRERDLDPGLQPRWAPKGLVTVGFDCDALQARVNVGATHHLTKGRDPKHSTIHGVNHYEWNEKLDDTITHWMREVAKGPALAFFGCDRNAADTGSEEITGATTLADELKKWHNTGHGPIDWIASYNRDGRVSGFDFDVYNDKEFFLHGDHFYLEGVYTVEPRKR